MDIQDNLSKNLVRYRKSLGLTQADIAEKLNYSDKAVSKWERGESVPDLFVLKQLADFYHVKIDTLIDTPKEDKPKIVYNITKKRAIISICATVLVWIIATLSFVLLNILFNLQHTWLSFIYACFITNIVLLTFSGIWGKNIVTTVFISLSIWTALLSVYLTLNCTLPTHHTNLWEIFLIGIPLQILTIFILLYKRVK